MKQLRTYGLLLAVLAVLAMLGLRARPDGRLHVYFLSTPGDAVLIRGPQGGFVLIDGGSDPALLALELGQRLPFWRRSLDAVVLTRPDGQRLPGVVAALTRYRATTALAPAETGKGAIYQRYRALLHEQSTPVVAARRGQRLAIGGATLTVLATPQGDEQGLVLRLAYGHTRLLLAPLLDEAQATLLAREQATLAYLPWARDVEPSLLRSLHPRSIVYADGYTSKHPPQHSYHERAASGAQLYHEKNDGTIEFVSDGRRAWVVVEDQ
jgi:beta-lactamase superfamily II metal-dependent hydrolase